VYDSERDLVLRDAQTAAVTTTTSTKSTSTKTTSSSKTTSTTSSAAASTSTCAYWLDNVKHRGIAAFNANPTTYQVYRNVKDFGAKGDGVTDDAPAINRAISSGNRCTPGVCNSTTTTPAVVYFPPGVYMINSTITDYYYTQLIG
jgi:glucan 1,3-beta-glucosidase